MTAPATAPVEGRRCPSCSAPVSDRAAICAFCDAVLDPRAAALAPAPAPRRARARSARPSLGAFALRFLARTAIVLSVVAAIVIGGAALLARMVQKGVIARAERAAAGVMSDSSRSDWRELDAAVVATARTLGASAQPDTAAASALAAISRRGRANDELLAGGPAADSAVASPRPPLRPSARLKAFAALPARPAGALRDSLVMDTLDARLALWRRLAYSAALPAMWPYSEKVTELRDPMVLPVIGFSATRELAQRNASAALLAASRGDTRGAVRHLRENVAAAGQVMRVPMTIYYLVGRMIVRESATMMGDIARVTRDSALAAEAAAIGHLAERRAAPNMLAVASTVFFADLADPRGPALVADRRLPPGARLDALAGVATGACLRTSELVFGVSSARRAALDAAANGLRDLEGSEVLIGVQRRWLDDLIERPNETFTTMARYGGSSRRRPSRVPFVGGAMARTWGCLRAI